MHLTGDELDRYYLGTVKREAGLAPLEEHLISCPECADRARSGPGLYRYDEDCADANRREFARYEGVR